MASGERALFPLLAQTASRAHSEHLLYPLVKKLPTGQLYASNDLLLADYSHSRHTRQRLTAAFTRARSIRRRLFLLARNVMTLLLLFVILPPLDITTANSLPSFLFWGFLLGMAGSSFATGVPYVSRWFSAERLRLALGIFAMGSGAVFKLVPQYFPKQAGTVTGLGGVNSLRHLPEPLHLLTTLYHHWTTTMRFIPGWTVQ